MYLRNHVDTFGRVYTNLNDVLTECGYSINTHCKSAYDDFRKILNDHLSNNGYVSIDKDIMKVSTTELFKLQLSYDKNLFITECPFVFFSIDEYEKISSYKGKVKKSILTGVYLYIKQFISYDNEINNTSNQIAYPSKKSIADSIGVSSTTTIESSLSILEELNMIYIIRGLYVENKNESGSYIPTRNGYTLQAKYVDIVAFKTVLTNLYQTNVYEKNEVEGKIKFISPKVRNSKK